MRMEWFYLALMLALSGCVKRVPIVTYDRLDDQNVGTQAGDTVETLPWAVGTRPVTGFSAIRAFDRGGKLAVCGSVVIVGRAADIKVITQRFADIKSIFLLGDASTATRQVAIRPTFMRRHILEADALGTTLGSIDFTRYPGQCVVTEFPWLSGYATAHRLLLVQP